VEEGNAPEQGSRFRRSVFFSDGYQHRGFGAGSHCAWAIQRRVDQSLHESTLDKAFLPKPAADQHRDNEAGTQSAYLPRLIRTGSDATLRNGGPIGDIIVNNFDEMHQRTEAGFRMGSMSLTIDDLDAACKAITGREFSVAPFKHLVRPSAALMSRLLKSHETVGEIARTMPDLLERPEVVRALEQQLAYLMVRCLTEGTVSTMTNGSYRHDKIVARFEAYLEAHPGEPLYLTEICAAVGAPERTLRIACAEHLGIGPIRYLALRRMHLVRRALLRGDSSTTVTRVATDHGFWELGRFAVAYRMLFGETPSASLYRPPDDGRSFPNRSSSFADADLRVVRGNGSRKNRAAALA